MRLPAKRLHQAPEPRSPTYEPTPTTLSIPETPLTAPLDTLTPLTLRRVVSPEDRASWKAALQTHHYLGYTHPIGAQLGYLVVSATQPHPLIQQY